MKQGYFISFEGGDGAGKSTQIKKLKQYFESEGYQVVLTREPGGTEIGEKIRHIILDPVNDKMTGMTEVMLYAASRAQHVAEIIRPSLEAGKIVICDRFMDSSLVYQGYARGLGECVSEINRHAVDACMPDLTFLLKIDPRIGSSRMKHRKKDRIEMETGAFHQAVYEGYEHLEKMFPDRIIGIDASGSITEIEKQILQHVEKLLQG